MKSPSVRGGIIVLLALMMGGLAQAQYILFDQDTDTISVPGDTVFGSAFTIEARVRLCASLPAPEVARLIFQEQFEAVEDKQLGIGADGMSGTAWRTFDNRLNVFLPVTPGVWHHAAFVVDGNAERLYLDGALRASRTEAGAIGNTGLSKMSIGAFVEPSGPMDFRPSFRGLLDWVRVSSVARYSGASFPQPTSVPADGSTVLLYNFNEPAGSVTVADDSSNGWDGSLGVGFPGATSPSLRASAACPPTVPALGAWQILALAAGIAFVGLVGIRRFSTVTRAAG